jgi:hypothetical protein
MTNLQFEAREPLATLLDDLQAAIRDVRIVRDEIRREFNVVAGNLLRRCRNGDQTDE